MQDPEIIMTTRTADEMDETRPTKRRRLSNESANISEEAKPNVAPIDGQPKPPAHEQNREFEVGIRAYVNPSVTEFVGVLKTRYSDFLVNEILPTGKVVHLRTTKPPKLEKSRIDTGTTAIVVSTSQLSKDATATEEQSQFQTQNGSSQPPKDALSAEEQSQPGTQNGAGSDKKQDGKFQDITNEQRQRLAEYLNEKAADEILELYESMKASPSQTKAKDHPIVRTEFTADRSIRGQIHQFIRETFKSSIESSTDQDGILVLRASRIGGVGKQQQGNSRNGGSKNLNQNQNNNQRFGKLGWADRGGEYVHFTLYKENKDTMEAISWLSRQLKSNAKNFQFAGTKDRRAITSQRCSAYRIEAERLAAQNQTLRGSKVGDFEHHTQGLELGDLFGNEFVITLRGCKMLDVDGSDLDLEIIQQNIQQRMQSLRENGYLNYFGQQRFGTFSMRTDVIGLHILREDFKAACDAILFFQPDALEAAQDQESQTMIGQDDKNRALAIYKWQTEGRLREALDVLPRKFSAEAQLMRHLTRSSTDYLGALMTIQRNLRLMYVHAYQSYIWNLVATNRMKLYGNKVVKGDLILVSEHKDQFDTPAANGTSAEPVVAIDADGEQIIEPTGDDRAVQEDDMFERARALTEEEANSGKYTMSDIVLALPGYDILYPDNASGEFYKTFMASAEGGELDPYNMRRKQREFSLSGSYRKMLARIGEDYAVEAHRYTRDDEQFVKTDLELMQETSREDEQAGKEEDGQNGKTETQGDKIAVVLKFQLGSSQYATMALRELSGGGIVPYKTEFSGGK